MARVTSPGHKLGQDIGTKFLENFFSPRLTSLAEELGDFYCDKKGHRPSVRGKKKKVSWEDAYGNLHDLDFVIEKGGSFEHQGNPAAFIELAWRRYTKHARNKVGEIEAALIPLKNTYQKSCSFSGVIWAGVVTPGALKQLQSHGIYVLFIDYHKVVDSFLTKNVNLDYPEDATNDFKHDLLKSLENLSESDMHDIERIFEELIKEEYDEFIASLKDCISRKIERVILLPLYGEKITFESISDALLAINDYEILHPTEMKFQKFEIIIKYSNGDNIDGSFRTKEDATQFLEIIKQLNLSKVKNSQSKLID